MIAGGQRELTGLDAALELIGKARGMDVPDTEDQRDWIKMFSQEAKVGGVARVGRHDHRHGLSSSSP